MPKKNQQRIAGVASLARRALTAATHGGGWVKHKVRSDPGPVVSQPWNQVVISFNRPSSTAVAWIQASDISAELQVQQGIAADEGYNMVMKVMKVEAWCKQSLQLQFRATQSANSLVIEALPELTIEDHPGVQTLACVGAHAPSPGILSDFQPHQTVGYASSAVSTVYFKIYLQWRTQKAGDIPSMRGFLMRSGLREGGSSQLQTLPQPAEPVPQAFEADP